MLFRRRKTRPTAAEAAQRLLALKYVAVDAHAAPAFGILETLQPGWTEIQRRDFVQAGEAERDQYWKQIRASGLWRVLSPLERAYVTTPKSDMSNQLWLNGLWRLESARVLAWALGLLVELPCYDTQADLDELKAIPHERIDWFVKSAILRPQTEIDRARDVAELWHWRSRTRQLIEERGPFPTREPIEAGGYRSFDDVVRVAAQKSHEKGDIPAPIDVDFPAKGKAYRDLTANEWSEVQSITMERHFALNWLCGHAPRNRWDETPTDT